ncbi:hypothetical protein A2V49_02515 [candidate division WWE3 bacterium RBG_19FT_COMBO_34_6]|uniref:4Fe-4S ferredoxin-type domain-containing protein n=1 Tax=candidate division WWE3 bacterium RBG_19FT_COMBO_34_6 TaxID=1802612 RepID=A0A1F4UM21_UNCKA|nr:MAG: hypothetical protein A2V49_02515 [candidate division WWE3 bacterium RBG_19FT_COMBO_34_6]
MTKNLKISFPQKCIGCELCVLEVQRQLKKVGLEGSFIRVFKKKKDNSDFLEYILEVDPRINSLDLEKIKSSCPTEVFEIIEGVQDGLIE